MIALRHRSSEHGFTLLEIVAVLVLLALMDILVIAHGHPRSAVLELRAAAGGVAQGLRSARSLAIATDKRVVFRMDVKAHTFAVGDAAPVRLSIAIALSVEAITNEVVGERSAEIGFAPDGSSSGGSIDLVDDKAHIRVEVAWLTGRVTIAEVAANAG